MVVKFKNVLLEKSRELEFEFGVRVEQAGKMNNVGCEIETWVAKWKTWVVK